MLNVMFENSKGQLRIIGTVENKESAFKVINDFLDDHKYKSYYQRTWNKDDKTTVVDVGSHTEFFYIQETGWKVNFMVLKAKDISTFELLFKGENINENWY